MKFSAIIPSSIAVIAVAAAFAAPANAQTQTAAPSPFQAGGGNCTSPAGQKYIFCTLDAMHPALEVSGLIQHCQNTAVLTCDPNKGPWTTIKGRPGKLHIWFKCSNKNFRALPVVPAPGAYDLPNVVSLSPDTVGDCYAKFYVAPPVAHKAKYREHTQATYSPTFANA